MTSHMYVGIDIGGTSIKIGIIQDTGKIVQKWEIPTNLNDNGMFIVPEIWESIHSNLATMQIDVNRIVSIGVGSAGFIDNSTGIVYEAVNIGWKNFDLKSQIEKISGLPVFVGNDANIAALGEHWQGAGKGADNLIAITLGTGVGGGIIANGKIIGGTNGTAGEIGHLTVDPDGVQCNCGRRGCLETIASATGIVRQGLESITANPTSQLAQLYKKNNEITAKDIFTLANQGDSHCQEIVQFVATLLGYTIANLAVITNPSKVLIGGGVSKAGNFLLRLIRTSFEQYALPRVSEACEIDIAQLGNDAGIIGAAYFAKQNLI